MKALINKKKSIYKILNCQYHTDKRILMGLQPLSKNILNVSKTYKIHKRFMMRAGYILLPNQPAILNKMFFFYKKFLNSPRTERDLITFCSTIIPIHPALAQQFITVVTQGRLYSIRVIKEQYPNIHMQNNNNKLFVAYDQLHGVILSDNILKKHSHVVKAITVCSSSLKKYSVQEKMMLTTIKDTNQVDPDVWWVLTADGWTSHMDYKSTTKIFKAVSGHIFCTSNEEEFAVGCKKLFDGLFKSQLPRNFKDTLQQLSDNTSYSWVERNDKWQEFLLLNHKLLNDVKPSFVFLLDLPYHVKNQSVPVKYSSCFNTESFVDRTSTLTAIAKGIQQSSPETQQAFKQELKLTEEAFNLLLEIST